MVWRRVTAALHVIVGLTGTRGLVPLLQPERAGPTPSALEGLRGGGGGSKVNQGVPGPAS